MREAACRNQDGTAGDLEGRITDASAAYDKNHHDQYRKEDSNPKVPRLCPTAAGGKPLEQRALNRCWWFLLRKLDLCGRLLNNHQGIIWRCAL